MVRMKAAATETRIPIGRFARLTGLSVGALRHYDELDLLRPIDVDRFTGYRRYAPDQVEIARTIARLRDLEVPLEEIRAVLGTDDPSEQRRRVASARKPGNQVGTARRLGEQGRGQPGALQQVADIVNAIGLVAGRVGGVEADERAQNINGALMDWLGHRRLYGDC